MSAAGAVSERAYKCPAPPRIETGTNVEHISRFGKHLSIGLGTP